MTSEKTKFHPSEDILKKPRKRKRQKRVPSRFSDEVLDVILEDYKSPKDLVGEGGVLKELIAALVNRVMDVEMSEHLGYSRSEAPQSAQSNRRNGHRSKKLRSDHGEFELHVPRDREGTFEPQLVPKHSREFRGFDEKIVSMYARGMTVRDIQSHLAELYGVDVSPDLVSRATSAVVEELHEWQHRPLEMVYPIVYVDAIMVKIRHKGVVSNRAVHVAALHRLDGCKEVLGMWIAAQEGAKFWLSVLTELRQRGVKDIFILCADGLKGMPEAVEATFPDAIFQTCVVHLIRASTRYVSWKLRRPLCADLRAVLAAVSEEAAAAEFEIFSEKWGEQCPLAVKTWRDNWAGWVPFLAYPDEIRRIVYTTNAIEALHRQFRKVLKNRGHMPSDEAALKLLFLASRNAEKTWGGRSRTWHKALAQFAILFEGRIPS